MICKTITVDGKEVKFRASATIPRLYRFKFGRDILLDTQCLAEAYQAKMNQGKNIDADNLFIFENVAYIMAKHGDPDNVPDSPEAWLDGFNVFSIYDVFPHLIELWGLNTETQAESKKKLQEVAGG